jgi:hypothetical protein
MMMMIILLPFLPLPKLQSLLPLLLLLLEVCCIRHGPELWGALDVAVRVMRLA